MWISLYRVSEEIRALSIFKHPRFIAPVAMGTDTNCLKPWIAFPFFPVTLRDLILKRSITDAEKAVFTVQLIEILRYLRSIGWMHGDLKPDNFCIQYNSERSINSSTLR